MCGCWCRCASVHGLLVYLASFVSQPFAQLAKLVQNINPQLFKFIRVTPVCGAFSKMIPFNSISSLIGSAGCPRPPLTVHRTRTSGPKSASSANLTVNKLALSSLCRSLYFSRMVCTVSSFILSMALDGRGALCLHVRIGFSTQSGGGFRVFVE